MAAPVPAPSAGPIVYAADPPEARLATMLDGLTLVYHRPSRTTHLLASPAPELLAALEDGPADAAALTARILADEPPGPDGVTAAEALVAAQALVATHLADLEAAGLVARA